jgi:enediyne core biosynthesis thioesterase
VEKKMLLKTVGPTGIDLTAPSRARLEKAQPQPLTFDHTIDIYLKDSNAYTNTYFSRYFEWQGVCRERWFHQCIQADMLQNQGVFITKRAHQEYVQETFPFQTVACKLNTFEVKQCSFYLLFQFSVGDSVVSTGYQQVVFASHEKRIQRLPEDVLAKVRRYEQPMATLPN